MTVHSNKLNGKEAFLSQSVNDRASGCLINGKM